MVSGEITLASFDADAHKRLLASWLARPNARQWWGDPAVNLHEALAPAPGMGQALFLLDDRPVGYMRWQPMPAADLTELGLPDPPEGVLDVDVLLGDDHLRGHGIATAALRLLSARLLADASVPFLTLCTPVDNHAATRAFEKAGFTRTVQYEDPEWGPCWVMVYPAPPDAA
jgi:RimJ/RimL family protein N-acetyltransferase